MSQEKNSPAFKPLSPTPSQNLLDFDDWLPKLLNFDWSKFEEEDGDLSNPEVSNNYEETGNELETVTENEQNINIKEEAEAENDPNTESNELHSNKKAKTSENTSITTSSSNSLPKKYVRSKTRRKRNQVDMRAFLGYPQKQAAEILNIPSSTLHKRWKSATKKKWPFRSVAKLYSRIKTLEENLPYATDKRNEIVASLEACKKELYEEIGPEPIWINTTLINETNNPTTKSN